MRILLLVIVLLLHGCASSPYVEGKLVYQHDRGSDWVLQSERKWTPDESEMRLHVSVGLEWDRNISCPYVETIVSGPWDWTGIGCSWRFGGNKGKEGRGFYIEPSLIHQVDSETSPFLRTDQKQWQGHNPFAHLRIGYRFNGFRCPVIATGKSLFQGAPFESEEGAPDLYWTNVECGARFWGKTGMWK